ncbi:MAG: hypothetical protein MUE50_26420 [Pirellulaceae bacterium]|nr:hypothetical protein [Pirellulaceae bacterium]
MNNPTHEFFGILGKILLRCWIFFPWLAIKLVLGKRSACWRLWCPSETPVQN